MQTTFGPQTGKRSLSVYRTTSCKRSFILQHDTGSSYAWPVFGFSGYWSVLLTSLIFLFCTEILALGNQLHTLPSVLYHSFQREATQICPKCLKSTIFEGSHLQKLGTSACLLELPRDNGIYYSYCAACGIINTILLRWLFPMLFESSTVKAVFPNLNKCTIAIPWQSSPKKIFYLKKYCSFGEMAKEIFLECGFA